MAEYTKEMLLEMRGNHAKRHMIMKVLGIDASTTNGTALNTFAIEAIAKWMDDEFVPMAHPGFAVDERMRSKAGQPADEPAPDAAEESEVSAEV